ncbi:FGGY family carbohydrate kinase [Candidatus Poriferisodalis sp.]|uniref:FGGY family carbohydrate kinase n=1 Tax=Candidatus Poriferisodalis sp. TaxID=3101277 RepID=UPI003B02270A
MALVVAIDAGTTGVRSMAVDETGAEVAYAYRPFPQHYPGPGLVEHDADEIWEATAATLAELCGSLQDCTGPQAPVIAAIGITNQRETLVAWDRRSSEPLARALVWQDVRTATRCAELEAAGHLEEVRRLTGLVLSPYFSGTKAEWLLRDGGVPRTADLALGTVDSWLMWKLSDGAAFVTDPTNASRTLLYDLNAGEWSEPICDLLSVPMAALAEVRPSSGRFCLTADTTALGPGIAVSGVAGDQQAALFGQGCHQVGMAKNTYGTGSFVLMNVGDSCPSPVKGLLTTVAWDLGRGPVYALEGSIFATGAAVGWLTGILDGAADPAAVETLARSVDDSGGVIVVPALAGLGSPWWDPTARGAIMGLTFATQPAHIARATIESMALQTRDVIEAMIDGAGRDIAELRIDGGAATNDLLCAIQADQLGVAVSRPVVTETTALGAAMLAGLAEGVWSSPAEAASLWQLERRFEPEPQRADADELHGRWREALRRSLQWPGG